MVIVVVVGVSCWIGYYESRVRQVVPDQIMVKVEPRASEEDTNSPETVHLHVVHGKENECPPQGNTRLESGSSRWKLPKAYKSVTQNRNVQPTRHVTRCTPSLVWRFACVSSCGVAWLL